MFKNKASKILGTVKKILAKFRPRFSVHYIVYTVLLTFVIFSVVSIVTATTPNPGHPWAELGDGVFAVTNNQTATRTYTFPDASTTILTTNATVTVGQGGTGINTLASNGILYGNGTGAVQALAVNAGAVQCLTQASSGTPAWGACGGGGGVTSLSAIGSTPNANGATITGSVLNLEPASASFGGVVTTGTQTFAGAKTFNSDILAHTLTVGLGAGAVATNTAVGYQALNANTTGDSNVANGYQSLLINTQGKQNTAIGNVALSGNIVGNYNTALGDHALTGSNTDNNVAIGSYSLFSATGTQNTAVGTDTFSSLGAGDNNTALGYNAGATLTSGSTNVFIGYNAQPNISTTGSNQLNIGNWVYGDNGNISVGDSTPASMFTVGTTSQFQVDSSGAITAATGLTSSGTITLSGLGGGGTKCVQTDNAGVITAAAAACGSGGGGAWDTISAPTGTQSLTFDDGELNSWTVNSNTETFQTVSSSTLTSGTLLSLVTTGTGALTGQKGLNISLSGANGTGAQTTYGIFSSNTKTGTSNNVGLYSTASGGTYNYAGIFESGRVLIGTASETASISNLYVTKALVNETGSTGAGVAGIHEVFTMNPTSGTPTQVGNRLTIENTTGSVASTQVGQIIRMTDSTSALANTIRGLEVVASVGTNTSGTNTGIRATGATFGVQGITTGLAGSVLAPAALYGEMQGTTQGDGLRLYSTTITTSPQLAYFYQDTSTFSGNGITMDFATGTGTFSGNFVDFQNNNVSKFKVTSAGVVSMGLGNTASTNAVCSSLANATGPTAGTAYEIRDCNAAPAADYAEMYPVETGIEYGDIVVTGTEMVNTYDVTDGNIDWTKLKGTITQLVKSNTPYQSTVIGIVSDNHGDFTSAGHNIKDIDNPMPIALNGRVPVKVASDSEPIMPGEYVTTSGTEPGKATKATKGGHVVGKALELWTPGTNTPTVMVYVEQGFYDGQNISQFAGIDPLANDFARQVLEVFMNTGAHVSADAGSSLIVDRLAVGVEIITSKVTANEVAVNTISAGTGTDIGLVLDADGKFIVRSSNDQTGTPSIVFDSLGNATFKGKVTAKDIDVTDLSGIQSITDQINQLAEGQTAFSLTASVINTLSGALAIAQSDILRLEGAIALSNTRIEGLTTAGVDMDTRLRVIETLLSANAFDSLVSLTTNTLQVNNDARFNGLSTFSGGALFASGVTIGGQAEFLVPPLFNKDTAGFALVKAGDKRVRVLFGSPYLTTPVVNTSMTFEESDNVTDTDATSLFASNINFVVLSKDQTGFTIMLSKNAPRDIRFSWVALSVKDPQLFESAIEGLTIDPEPIIEIVPTPEPEPEITPEVISEPTPIPEETIPTPEGDGTPINTSEAEPTQV